MALGDYSNNDNSRKKYYEPQVYSKYGTSNTDGVDPSALSYSFFNGLLKISIAPMLPSAKPDDKQLWDHQNEASIWLPHFKAKLLLDEINYVQAHPDEVNNGGIIIGEEGLISFSNGKEIGASSPCLIIRKIDQNTGEATSVYAYQFKTDYYKTVRNYNPADPSNFEFVDHPIFEIEQFKELLRTYSSSMSGAAAYAQMYYERFETNRTRTKLELIMDKLGIESAEYGRQRTSSGGGQNKSYFNNAAGKNNSIPSNTGMRSTTMDALADDIE